MNQINQTKRITAVIDAKQNSKIISAEKIFAFSPYDVFPSFQIQELFYTEDLSQSLLTRHLSKPYDIALPKGAMRIKIMRLPTTAEMAADLEKADQPVPEDWEKYNLHNTDSIDYIYVLSGRVKYVVGDERLRLNQGDFLAQIGAEHIFVNDGDTPCMMLCIMVGTEPSLNRKKLEVE